MARLTIVFGSLLIALGLVVYFVLADPDEQGKVSVTALIPAFFGIPIALLGVVALKEKLRMHAIHGAVLLGMLGMVGALMRPLPKLLKGELEMNTPAMAQFTMATICLVFVVLCVCSFIKARKNRLAQTPSDS